MHCITEIDPFPHSLCIALKFIAMTMNAFPLEPFIADVLREFWNSSLGDGLLDRSLVLLSRSAEIKLWPSCTMVPRA
jgi:hypothetical protein